MSDIRARYPGAQPFSDDEFSRKMFFGRDHASTALTNQILANRIVVVYAKSGLGKTSLLNAGVAPRLRDERYLPLFVRVNDVRRGPLASVLEGVRAEADRQQVEYIPGMPDSLWTFFKTVEFWRGDLLLMPVLILDQFEELFTLQPEQARESFLTELSHLVRGIRPPASPEPDIAVSEGPPPLRIVLSLREDYLGFLEEASDHIPQILDHRFRLAPLSLQAAAEAMTGPASIEEPDLATRPFHLDAAAVAEILDYLSRRRAKSIAQTTRYVEPFQLQLVCQSIEEVVAQRQKVTGAALNITMEDIGGETAVRETLKNFYVSSVHALPTKRVRRAVRRLCEQFLISPEGRRLSLEEMEIRKQLNLFPETLRLLVSKRLLRSETRSDSSYYELSHDALIEPVLATRRRNALMFGWLGLGITSTGLTIVGILLLAGIFEAFQQAMTTEQGVESVQIVFVMAAIASFGILMIALFRRNLRTLRRYRPRTPDELADTLVASHSRMGVFYGAISILMGGFMLLFALGGVVFQTVQIVNAYLGNLTHTNPNTAQLRQSISEAGLGLDMIAEMIAAPVILLFGARVLRWGIQRLLQAPHAVRPQPTEVTTRALALSGLGFIAGALALLAAVTLMGTELAEIGCAYHLEGQLPGWVPSRWFNSLAYDCQKAYDTGYGAKNIISWSVVIVVLAEATLLLGRSLRNMRAMLHKARSARVLSGEVA